MEGWSSGNALGLLGWGLVILGHRILFDKNSFRGPDSDSSKNLTGLTGSISGGIAEYVLFRHVFILFILSNERRQSELRIKT